MQHVHRVADPVRLHVQSKCEQYLWEEHPQTVHRFHAMAAELDTQTCTLPSLLKWQRILVRRPAPAAPYAFIYIQMCQHPTCLYIRQSSHMPLLRQGQPQHPLLSYPPPAYSTSTALAASAVAWGVETLLMVLVLCVETKLLAASCRSAWA